MSTVYDLNGAAITEYNTPQIYGAVADGGTDCSTAIEALLAANIGGTVYFPEGVYAISRPIKTYPYYDKGVNIIFHQSATVIPLAEMEYMLDIGGLSQDVKVGRGKKIISGGRFEVVDTLVQSAVIHINTKASDVDLSNMTIIADECSGVIVGEENVSGSNDAYIHNMYIRHSNKSNSNSGILLYSSDNNISDCRVYYFGVNINCYGGSEFITDVHTLANGQNEIEQVSAIVSGETFFTDFYGDSEDVFIKTRSNASPRIHMCNCTYFSYKDNNVTLFDIANTAKFKINGLNITCRANTEYTGVKLPYTSFEAVANSACFDIDGLQINNPQYMKDGDLLKGMRTNGKDTFFYPTAMSTGTWYLVGALAVNDTNNHSIKIKSENGISEIPLSVKCTSLGVISVDIASGKIITTDSGMYQIGYKLNNSGFDSASEYPLVNVYIKRISGGNRTLYKFDVESNLMARISPNGDYLSVLSSTADTPDIVCAVDCDNSSVAIAA